MADDLVSFGAWVRLRRQALVLTRDELAGRIGVAEVTVRKVEADERRPSPQVAALLAQHLGLDASQHALFVQVARGVLPVERLPPPIPGREEPTPSAQPPHTTLPSGTVTFLFTDIEGSTRRWEQHPQVMRAAVIRHDALLREAVEAHGGHVFKTVGDAVCAAFASAPEALAAALAAQRALLATDWGAVGPLAVRMALHTGTATAEAGDYLGPPLNRVARLLSAGHGGQVLLSLATRELVRDHLPPGTTLRHLGEHRLKDLARPEAIYQLDAPDLPSDFPALTSFDARRTNLPTPATELIGRTHEVATVVELIGRARLVTLTGPGGTGKTRLALQVGAELLDRYPDGVWFVDLSPISNPAEVPRAVAEVLGIPESPARSTLEGLRDWVRARQALVILDNCEQIVGAAAELATELLRSGAAVRLLTTSRIPLRLAFEQEYAVRALAFPDQRALPALAQISQYDAIALFLARARAVRSDFSLTAASAITVAEICARLDGLPLAIELAAARVRLFPLEHLLSRLSATRLQTLGGGARDLPARQQTIRATIEWSVRLLRPEQQTLLARLGVFVGGWTLEAAEAVCGDHRVDALSGLEMLVEQSLVQSREVDGEARFSMLETIREYALEQLDTFGESEHLRQRHTTYFTALAEQAEPNLRSLVQRAWVVRLDADDANLTAALVWSIEHGRADAERRTMGLRLATSLWRYWLLTNRIDQALHWLDATWPGDLDLPPALRARAVVLIELVDAWFNGIRFFHKRLTPETLAFVRASGDRSTLALALAELALFKTAFVGDAADGYGEESVALARELDDVWLRAYAQLGYGAMLHFVRHRAEESLASIRKGLQLAEQAGDTWMLMCGHWTLGLVQLEQQQFDGAAVAFSRQLGYCDALETFLGRAYGLWGLSMVAFHNGDLARAERYNLERSDSERQVGNMDGINSGLLLAGAAAMDQGNFADAQRYFTQARAALAALDRSHRQFIVGHHRLADQIWWPVMLALYLGDRAAALEELRFRAGVIDTLEALGEETQGYRDDWKIVDAIVAFSAGDIARAQHHITAVLDRRPDVVGAMYWQAYVCAEEGEGQRAALLMQRVHERNVAAQFGDWDISEWQLGLGEMLLRAARQAEALPPLLSGLNYVRRSRARARLPRVLEVIGTYASIGGAQGVRLLGAAAALREQLGAPMWPVHRPQHDTCIASLRAAAGDGAFEEAWQAGRALTWQQAADEALTWLRAQEAAS